MSLTPIHSAFNTVRPLGFDSDGVLCYMPGYVSSGNKQSYMDCVYSGIPVFSDVSEFNYTIPTTNSNNFDDNFDNTFDNTNNHPQERTVYTPNITKSINFSFNEEYFDEFDFPDNPHDEQQNIKSNEHFQRYSKKQNKRMYQNEYLNKLENYGEQSEWFLEKFVDYDDHHETDMDDEDSWSDSFYRQRDFSQL